MPPRTQDTEDKIGTQQVRVGSSKRGRGDDGGSGSDDYSDSDDDDGPLHPAAWLGMHPGLVAAHLQMRPCDCCSQPTPAPLLGKAVSVAPWMGTLLLDELRRRGLPFVVAPYEADPQLAFLVREGHAYAALSEDSDDDVVALEAEAPPAL